MRASIFLLAFCCISSVQGLIDKVDDTEEQEISEFNSWKEEYSKKFGSKEEEAFRFKVFEENNRKIKIHNAEKEITYQMGLNQFSDLTDEEFKSIYLIDFSEFILESEHRRSKEEGKNEDIHHEFILHKQHNQHTKKSYDPEQQEEHSFVQTSALPASVDLSRQQNINWPIRTQGSCGSCWAFSTIGTIEQSYFYRKGKLVDFSEQQLVDCLYPKGGCNGGFMMDAFNYFARNKGPFTEQSYPYGGVTKQCRTDYIREREVLRVRGVESAPTNPGSIRQFLQQGKTLTACVDASNWNTYKSGIFTWIQSNFQCSHGVVIVGYGSEGQTPYFKLRNSWGTGWGEGGYIRVNANTKNGYNIGSLSYDYMFAPVIQIL